MSTVEQLFEFCEKNNITDNFTMSLKSAYAEYDMLTKAQTAALRKKVNDYTHCQKLLSKIKSECEFVCNVKKFFDERGFLTEKQLSVLKRYS